MENLTRVNTFPNLNKQNKVKGTEKKKSERT